jgi:hypothetical protein
MELPKSTRALELAERHLADLRAVRDDAEAFTSEFVSCSAMINRVGAVIDSETKGRRTPQFGDWWKATAAHPLSQFVNDVRNAVFKRGEDRQRAQHHLQVADTVRIQSRARMVVMRDGKVIDERESTAPAPEPDPLPEHEAVHTITWLFDGGAYDGQEVLELLRVHVERLRGLVAEAERRLS